MEYLFRGFCPDENGTQEIWTDGTCNGEKVKCVIKGKWIEGYSFKSWDKCYILWGTTNDIPNMIEVIPETVGEYIKSLQNGDKAFSNSRFEIISNVKGENGYSVKRTDTATIRFNEKQCEWELKVSHKGKYKRIARAGYFLNNSDTKVIGTVFDKEEK